MSFSRSSGILLHPSSLPGQLGIGDLGPAAYRWIDFLQRSDTKLWQVLPLGPTGYADSPYQCLSALAGNPYLISPELLLQDGLLVQSDLANLPPFPTDSVDYGEVIPWKTALLQNAYWRHKRTGILANEFDIFFQENKFWLEDFALFMAVKQAHQLRPWVEWPESLRDRQPQAIAAFLSANRANIIEQHAFDQFLFFRQWIDLREYAHARSIKIIGDIPIYVAHDSSDVWGNRDLFSLEDTGMPTVVAGVPPDYFSETGQLWGNPIYRWDLLEKDGFSWWIQRLRIVLGQVDYIRLDHFRGFAGYWEVPGDQETAIHGRWLPGPGASLLQTLKDHLGELPLIAEDLGHITPDVFELRDRFNLPGMKIMQFGLEGDLNDPFLPHNYPENCVAYTGTHDNATSVGWYQEATPQQREFTQNYLQLASDVSDLQFSWRMIDVLWQSRAVLTVAPFQDLLGLDNRARMNFPGTTSGNWRWRMPEDALSDPLSSQLAELNRKSCR